MSVKATNYNGDTDYTLLEQKDVVDNLTSTSANVPLSANQGKLLKGMIDGIEVGTDPSVTQDISTLKSQMSTAQSDISELQTSDTEQDSDIAGILDKLQKGIFLK